MLRLDRARVYDPVQGWRGQSRSLFIENGRMVADPGPQATVERVIDLEDAVVMAGGIDIHSHIGSGKVNLARTLMPHDHARTERAAALENGAWRHGGSGQATPTSWIAGYRYAEMGYTAAFEPAMLPVNARATHYTLADTPVIDKGAYVLLGNDDLFLRLLARGAEPQRLADYVAWMLARTRSLAVKVVNPGGISAFKFNQRALDLDQAHAYYGVTPRQVLRALARAVHDLGVPHPLHVHTSNLGVPGNVATTLATMEAAEGLPLHLTHVQFHSYGKEGPRGFSSAAEAIAEAVNRQPNLSIDVGQVMFGQTATASGDTMAQYANRRHAHPHAWTCIDIECEAGCGVVPFRYRDRNFVHALQWAIGLELFLRVRDPWRIFLTTDHPNGAPYTVYPQLMRLLMDRGYRNRMLDAVHPEVAAHSALRGLDREYTLEEIAIVTRAGPARSLGLRDRGHLAPGAVADLVAYRDDPDRDAMFARPSHVFKDGELIVRDGRLLAAPQGATLALEPEFDAAIEAQISEHYARHLSLRAEHLAVGAQELADYGGRAPLILPCTRHG
ncbi:MAG: formylmethanofuran dehydrogenase subunit A [Nevskia sp.]|nr:formylmethanofuran dehydrogenase subunit A [Nevskia sp.]